jgi:hypothetical protein
VPEVRSVMAVPKLIAPGDDLPRRKPVTPESEIGTLTAGELSDAVGLDPAFLTRYLSEYRRLTPRYLNKTVLEFSTWLANYQHSERVEN